MSNINKNNYIELLYYKAKNHLENEYEIDNKQSWIISYIKKENCYKCENKYDNTISKMTNVENFIRIWNYNMYNKPQYDNDDAEIKIYVQYEYYSGYKCNRNNKIPIETIKMFTGLLKDIIDENKNEEDYNIIDNITDI